METKTSTIDSAVKTLLSGLEMSKYIPQFEGNMVSMQLFMSLTEEDLVTIGVEDRVDLDLIIKYIKKFQKGDQNKDLEPLSHEDVQQCLKNVVNHLYTIDVGTAYIQSVVSEEEPIDFTIGSTSICSGIGMLCDRVEHECNNFITEIDELIEMLERPTKNIDKFCAAGISLTILASVLAAAAFFRFRGANS